MLPFFEIHAYALLGNHYHLLLKVCSQKEILAHILKIENGKRTVAMCNILEEGEDTSLVSKTSLVSSPSSKGMDVLIDELLVHQIQRMSISYTKSLNNQTGRTGHLFNRPFKRCMINFESRYKYMMYYIHHNARKHGFVNDFLQYKHHSYFEILDQSSSLISGNRILKAFNGIDNFINFHKMTHHEDEIVNIVIEDDF